MFTEIAFRVKLLFAMAKTKEMPFIDVQRYNLGKKLIEGLV